MNDLRNYWKTPHWQRVRDDALYHSASHCQQCGAIGGVGVHHKTYARLGNELVNDVECLCKRCHAVRHGRLT